MAEIFSYIKPLSNLTGIANTDGSFKLFPEQLSSLNFNGVATKKEIKTKVSDIKTGQTVMVSDASYGSSSVFITKIDVLDGFIDNDPLQPVKKYYLYHLSDFSMEQPFTYNATYGDSYSADTELFVIRDDIDNFVLGTDGWTLTNNGNAIFSNVFVRGKIEATSGKIDGTLNIGENEINQPLVQIGSDIFNGASFETVSEKHSGILLDSNNYLLSYPTVTNLDINSVVITNSSISSYLYSATFTLPLLTGETNTLRVGDFIELSGFTDPKTTALNATHQVTAVDTNTFTIAVSYNINLTSPVTINVSVRSFALNKTYNLTSMTLSSVSDNIDVSTVKIYLDDSDFFSVGSEISLASFSGDLTSLNGRFKIIDQGTGYISVYSTRVLAGTYTSSLGSVVLYSKIQKFKVGDTFNNMSFSSETGSLKLTGTINAHSGNFINRVYVGQAATSFYVFRKKLAANVATLTTTVPHSFSIGDIVTVTGVDATFDGSYTIISPTTSNTFSYAKVASPVAQTDLVNFASASTNSSVDGTIKVGVAGTGISIDGTGDPLTSAIYAGEGEYGNVNTGFWMDASGRFSLKDKLTFDTSGNLTVSGTINASAGNFTNTVTIGQSSTQGKLQVGTGTSFFEIIGTNTATTTAIKTNSASYGTSGVWLDASGRFSLGDQLTFANGNLTITGNLTATSLTVGTNPNQIIISNTAVSGNPGMFISGSSDFIRNTGAFRLGGTNGISYSGSGNVTIGTGVNVNGNISGASGTFAGSIKIGSGESVFKADTSGIYLGNEDFVNAEFRVTPSGSLTATTANITGTINATAGIFSGNIQTTGKIYSGTLDGGGLLTSGVEVASTGIKGIINGVTAFNLPADGVTAPTITNFQVLNAKITGEGSNAYLIAGKLSDNITVRGDRTGVDATGAIFNTIANTPTTYAGGTGFYLNETGKFRFGTPTNYIRWDGTNLDITGDVRIGGTAGSTVVSNASTGAAKPDVYRQISAPTGTIKTGSIWYDTDDNNKTYVYDGTAWQATETNAAGVGLGNVSNLTPQNQAQTGLISGTTITGGGITLNGGGNIKGGQTAYDSGTGFFLGYESLNYKFSIGNSSGNKLIWNGTDLSVTGQIKATSGYIGGTTFGWLIDSNRLINDSGIYGAGLISTQSPIISYNLAQNRQAAGNGKSEAQEGIPGFQINASSNITCGPINNGTYGISAPFPSQYRYGKLTFGPPLVPSNDYFYKTGTGISGQSTISVSPNSTGIVNGMYVSGTGIATNATVTNISGTTITLSATNTAAVSGNILFSSSAFPIISLYGGFNFPTYTFTTGQYRISAYFYVPSSSPFVGKQITLRASGSAVSGDWTNTSLSPVTLVANSWVRATTVATMITSGAGSPVITATINGLTVNQISYYDIFTSSWMISPGSTLQDYFDETFPMGIDAGGYATKYEQVLYSGSTYASRSGAALQLGHGGNIYASVGKIGGFNLDSSKIYIDTPLGNFGLGNLGISGDYPDYGLSIDSNNIWKQGRFQVKQTWELMNTTITPPTLYMDSAGGNFGYELDGWNEWTPASDGNVGLITLGHITDADNYGAFHQVSGITSDYFNMVGENIGSTYLYQGNTTTWNMGPNLKVAGTINAGGGTTPVGSIMMWSQATLPSGWIFCFGQSTDPYPLLRAVVGPNVPNLVDKFIVGAGSSYAVKSTGGAANHSHGNTAVNATGGSHNHADTFSVNAHNHRDNITAGYANQTTVKNGESYAWSVSGATYRYHTHAISGNVTANSNTSPYAEGGTISGGVSNIAGHNHTITMTNNASSTIPPYYALYFIIYTGQPT
jgi:hypothetical protein